MTAFNALPKAAFVPILVVWFGIGAGPAILTAFLISFFPIMVNIATGLATLEPELEDVLRVLGARRWDVLVKVGLPRSMPYFYASLKVAITLAFVGTTVSEMTAANEGIGYLLISAGSAMQMGLAFAGLVVVGAMAAGLGFAGGVATPAAAGPGALRRAGGTDAAVAGDSGGDGRREGPGAGGPLSLRMDDRQVT